MSEDLLGVSEDLLEGVCQVVFLPQVGQRERESEGLFEGYVRGCV